MMKKTRANLIIFDSYYDRNDWPAPCKWKPYRDMQKESAKAAGEKVANKSTKCADV